MSDGTVIRKFPLQQDGGSTVIELTAAAKVRAVQLDRHTGWPAAWVEMNPAHPIARELELVIVVTDSEVPLGHYYGMFQTLDPSTGTDFTGHIYGNWDYS